MNEELLEEVNCFRYLEMNVVADGGVKNELTHKMGERLKVLWALKKLWKEKNVGNVAKLVCVKVL